MQLMDWSAFGGSPGEIVKSFDVVLILLAVLKIAPWMVDLPVVWNLLKFI